MLPRLHTDDTVLSDLGINVDAEASANRRSNVSRMSASLLSSAGAVEARMGLKAAKRTREDPRNILLRLWSGVQGLFCGEEVEVYV